MRRKKTKKLISELVMRREEVVSRARMIANKQVPEEIIDQNWATIVEWIITPHIQESYSAYKQPDDEGVRVFQNLMGKMLKAFSRKKGDKYKKS